jgi:hypothetical protein
MRFGEVCNAADLLQPRRSIGGCSDVCNIGAKLFAFLTRKVLCGDQPSSAYKAELTVAAQKEEEEGAKHLCMTTVAPVLHTIFTKPETGDFLKVTPYLLSLPPPCPPVWSRYVCFLCCMFVALHDLLPLPFLGVYMLSCLEG